MLPRSDLYVRKPPDFIELAKHNAVLSRGLTVFPDGSSTLDFQDEAVLRALTEALLLRDFGISVASHDVVSDEDGGDHDARLCPAIPNRVAYVAWIEALIRGTDLSLSRGKENRLEDSEEEEEGGNGSKARKRRKLTKQPQNILDIGTGAYSIYALLGCAIHSDWTFTGTDIDKESLRRARAIVEDPVNNTTGLNLRDRIDLVQRKPNDALLLLPHRTEGSDSHWPALHATMCNPPFYASRSEMAQSASEKHLPPSAVCTGADTEMVTPGGEVAFVSRLIDEGLVEPVRSQVVWFTSMVGKYASVALLAEKLTSVGITNYYINDLISGTKTRRWVLSWSHLPFHPRLASSSASAARSLAPPSSLPTRSGLTAPLRPLNECLCRTIKVNAEQSFSSLLETLRALPQDVVEVTTPQCEASSGSSVHRSIQVRAWKDAWTRRARRARKSATSDVLTGIDTSTPPILALTCTFKTDNEEVSAVASSDASSIDVEWTYGIDRDHFETFVNSVIVRWTQCKKSQ